MAHAIAPPALRVCRGSQTTEYSPRCHAMSGLLLSILRRCHPDQGAAGRRLESPRLADPDVHSLRGGELPQLICQVAVTSRRQAAPPARLAAINYLLSESASLNVCAPPADFYLPNELPDTLPPLCVVWDPRQVYGVITPPGRRIRTSSFIVATAGGTWRVCPSRSYYAQTAPGRACI